MHGGYEAFLPGHAVTIHVRSATASLLQTVLEGIPHNHRQVSRTHEVIEVTDGLLKFKLSLIDCRVLAAASIISILVAL